MAIAIDQTSSQPGAATSNTATWQHTVSGAQRLLLVGVGVRQSGSDATGSAVTYNAVSMSPVGTMHKFTSNWYTVELFALVNPDTGTHDVAVTAFVSALGVGGGAISLTGVDQTTPLGTPNAADVTSGALEVVVTSAIDDLVVDVAACSYAGTVLTADASQSQRCETYYSDTADGSQQRRRVGMSTKPGAASVTMLWTGQNGDGSAIIAVPVKPAAASSVTWLRHRA